MMVRRYPSFTDAPSNVETFQSVGSSASTGVQDLASRMATDNRLTADLHAISIQQLAGRSATDNRSTGRLRLLGIIVVRRKMTLLGVN